MKPILLIKIDYEKLVSIINKDRNVTMDAYDHIKSVQKNMEKKFYDYHVLVLPSFKEVSDFMSFETFYEKDLQPTTIEELKKEIDFELKNLCHINGKN